VVEAFKILTSDKQVKAILVNIFGARQASLFI
jgi:succinyl-CoA synthetase beta subunit